MCKLTSYNRSLEEKNYLESCRNVVEVDQEIRELEQQKQKFLKASQKPSPRRFAMLHSRDLKLLEMYNHAPLLHHNLCKYHLYNIC